MFRSILSVDLVRTYAEASNDNQILCLSQDPGCELRLRTYTNHVHVSAFGQFIALNAIGEQAMNYPTVSC